MPHSPSARRCPREAMKSNRTTVLGRALLGIAIALMVPACRQSYEEVDAKAKAEDAAAKQRARVLTEQREAAQRAREQRVPVPSAVAGSYACPVTAQRMIAKMKSCGMDMAGITPEMLCGKMDQPKINFAASRSCQKLEAMFSEGGP